MAYCTQNFKVELGYAFLLAAKYDFLSHYIRNDNLVYLGDSSIKYDSPSLKMEQDFTKDGDCELNVCLSLNACQNKICMKQDQTQNLDSLGLKTHLSGKCDYGFTRSRSLKIN